MGEKKMKIFVLFWEIISFIILIYGFFTYCSTKDEVKGIMSSLFGLFLIIIGFLVFQF